MPERTATNGREVACPTPGCDAVAWEYDCALDDQPVGKLRVCAACGLDEVSS